VDFHIGSYLMELQAVEW